MATLPIKPAKGSEKPELEKSLVALIKGCLPNCRVDDFPADPEKACKRQRNFLALWYNTSSMRKPEERKAFAEACPHLTKSEVKQIVNNVHDYKSFLHRKNRNQKTGEKTEPVFKGLFQAILGQKSQELAQGLEKKPSEECEKSEKPAKRLRSKTTPEKEAVSQKPEEAEQPDAPASSSCGIFFAWNQPEPAEASQSDKVPSEAGESILSISSSSGLVPASSLKSAKEEKAARPKAVQKKPSQKNQAQKKPAKKPAEATGSWLASPSFGWVHETKASSKAYLVYKKAWQDKASCLVNVNLPKGEKQSQVMAALVEKCKEEGWDKNKLVDYKNGLLAESLEEAD